MKGLILLMFVRLWRLRTGLKSARYSGLVDIRVNLPWLAVVGVKKLKSCLA